MKLTQELLKSKLTYDPSTGVFSRIDRNYSKPKICSTKNQHGYVMIFINYRQYSAHRLAWLYMTGELPTNEIDHINGQKDDNRWSNLREATRSQNLQNTTVRKDNTTGYKGVVFHKASGKFMARIMIGKVAKHLGLFPTAQEASAAYEQAASNLFGEFAYTGAGR